MVRPSPHADDRIGDVLRLLADERRRATIASLHRSGTGEVSVAELATELSEQDLGDTAQMKIHLRHAVLPRLATADVVRYDHRRSTVRYNGHPDVEAVMDCIATNTTIGAE